MKRLKAYLVVGLGVIFIGGCGTAHVDRNGQLLSDLSYPEVRGDISYKGVFIEMERLNKIRKGYTKSQIFKLIAEPQYATAFRSRMWTYVINFNTPNEGVDGISSCFFQVLFDDDNRARYFSWRAVDEDSASQCPSIEQPMNVSPRLFSVNAE